MMEGIILDSHLNTCESEHFIQHFTGSLYNFMISKDSLSLKKKKKKKLQFCAVVYYFRKIKQRCGKVTFFFSNRIF